MNISKICLNSKVVIVLDDIDDKLNKDIAYISHEKEFIILK